MLAAQEKQKLIGKVRRHEQDTGSVEVQIAILSEEITQLAQHLKKHPKDYHSRRGLLGMVQRRKKLLNYLLTQDSRAHARLLKKLGLKK